jgi:hypothetical protein
MMSGTRAEPRGDTLRIALIHAVYAAGWALVSIAATVNLSTWPAVSILILATVLAIFAARKLRGRQASVATTDPATARWVRRVNIITAVAALLYGWALSGAGQELRAIAAVLVVLGAHFVPMSWLLRRRSLLVIGIALMAIGLFVWFAPAAAATGAFFAALVFAGNSVRLLLR